MTLSALYIPTGARNETACDRGSPHTSGEAVIGDNVDEFTATDDTNPIKRVRGDTAAARGATAGSGATSVGSTLVPPTSFGGITPGKVGCVMCSPQSADEGAETSGAPAASSPILVTMDG